jgi:hypothetical protein
MCPEKLDQVHNFPARRFIVETLFFVVGLIVDAACEFRLILTPPARARLPMPAAERRVHEAFGAEASVAEKILHWKGEVWGGGSEIVSQRRSA